MSVNRLLSSSIDASDISVWGTIDTQGSPTPQSSYSIDGEKATIYTSQGETITQYHKNFFLSPVSPGEHTLIITMLTNGTLKLDYILLTPIFDRPSNIALNCSASASTVTPTASVPPSTAHKTPISEITGAVLGSLSFLLIIFAIISTIYIKRRRNSVTPPTTAQSIHGSEREYDLIFPRTRSNSKSSIWCRSRISKLTVCTSATI